MPAPATTKRPEPDWAAVHREMGRKGVTLDLLWQEYREQHADGYQYSAFCDHYRAYAQALPVTLRQSHAPGERLFVDYSGQTVPVIDPVTAEVRQAQIFVAVLGASSYTYVEATWSQNLADWTGSDVRCFEFLGGVPALLEARQPQEWGHHPELLRSRSFMPETLKNAIGYSLEWAGKIGHGLNVSFLQTRIERIFKGMACT